MKKTSVFENGLLWFGAAVSIAEIITGTYFAPLGFQKGMAAIVLGHVIGCALLFLIGMVSGLTEKSAMEVTQKSFGDWGGRWFAVLNIVQLIGWTGIMIYDGAIAADGVLPMGIGLWAILIGALIVLWIAVGVQNLGKLNTVAMLGLFVLTIVLSRIVFSGHGGGVMAEALSFGAAVELSIAMPLSWLPLIGDYTCNAKKPVKASLVSGIVYSLVSIWMYAIGLGAALFSGETNIVPILKSLGFGTIGLLIVVLSTVTTTFLDAYSAGVSGRTLWKKLSVKWAAIAVTVLGVIGAIWFPLENMTEFLYFIGSVFAPMVAVVLTDYFVLRHASAHRLHIKNMCAWAMGFFAYRLLMQVDFILGSTVPAMLITSLLCLLLHYKVFLRRVFPKG